MPSLVAVLYPDSHGAWQSAQLSRNDSEKAVGFVFERERWGVVAPTQTRIVSHGKCAVAV